MPDTSDSAANAIPDLLDFERPLRGRKVLVTGHTGFTGSWACMWLRAIGADVCGLALAPETSPSLYQALGIDGEIDSTIADIRDFAAVQRLISERRPDAILHLAAQPLVRRSYREPVATFAVNAMGTAHVLEAARQTDSVKAIVCITTDKVYRNNEWSWPYRENDPLGGKDPYSASKSAAEMIIHSYAESFGSSDGTGLAIATARGGNIIGGGDWSEDRLVPDYVRAVQTGDKLTLRFPDATRPWQHVLALVHAYLLLLGGLLEAPQKYARAWNFGPHDPKSYPVRAVFDILARHWEKPDLDYMQSPLKEAQALALDSSLARNLIDWAPVWNTEQVITQTAAWYRDYYRDPSAARRLTQAQLDAWRVALAQTAS